MDEAKRLRILMHVHLLSDYKDIEGNLKLSFDHVLESSAFSIIRSPHMLVYMTLAAVFAPRLNVRKGVDVLCELECN